MEHKASMPDRVMHVLVDLVVLLIQQSSLKSLNFNLPADFSFLSNPSFQALDKSKYRDGLRAVRRYIPRLEQDLELVLMIQQVRSSLKLEQAFPLSF